MCVKCAPGEAFWLNLALFQLVFFLADKRFFWRFACIKPNSDSRGLLVMGQDLKAARPCQQDGGCFLYSIYNYSYTYMYGYVRA